MCPDENNCLWLSESAAGSLYTGGNNKANQTYRVYVNRTVRRLRGGRDCLWSPRVQLWVVSVVLSLELWPVTSTGRQFLLARVSIASNIATYYCVLMFANSSTVLMDEGERIARVGFIQTGSCTASMAVPQARPGAQVCVQNYLDLLQSSFLHYLMWMLHM